MKAIVRGGYGSTDVHLQDVDMPRIKDDQVRVRVRAASLNALDWHTLHGGRLIAAISFLLRAPTSPVRGVDLAGEVESVGSKVTRLRPGDEVFGTGWGAFAEYAAAKEGALAPKPHRLSFAEAAAIGVAGVTALQGLRDKARVQPGQRVLIYGAGGGVGTFAVQIAKALGAHVTAATGPNNLEIVRSLAPDAVMDRTKEDFTIGGQRYDVIFDVAADRPLSDCQRALTPNGKLVIAGAAKSGGLAPLWRPLSALIRSLVGRRRLIVFVARVRRDDLLALSELVEAGKLRPVIDRQYSLHEVPEAVRYIGSGQARAKVVVTVA